MVAQDSRKSNFAWLYSGVTRALWLCGLPIIAFTGYKLLLVGISLILMQLAVCFLLLGTGECFSAILYFGGTKR